eukprot:TRINITY_DN292_c1_g1_i1.p1 TRINITY_DN292_c1_g1~~TRINITY_DN292_c1_g1_i1.p1  ORF type:complete len:703 (+),score=240.32 TRINITY_DN292_c1_g1_i1:122-2230(+)
MPSKILCATALLTIGAHARSSQHAEVAANPIRKVVNLMQKMATKLEKESEAEEELYKKFECYCKKQISTLDTAIRAAESRGPVTPEDIAAKKNEIQALKNEVKKMKSDKQEDEASLSAAKVSRKKDHDGYVKVVDEEKETEQAAHSALEALGGTPSFLQMESNSHAGSGFGAGVGKAWTPKFLRGLDHSKRLALSAKRKVAAFLQGKGNGADSTDVKVFIHDIEVEAEEEIKEEDSEEGEEVVDYKGVKTSKKAEIAAILNLLEKKMRAMSALEVEVQNMKWDMKNGAEALADNKKMLAEVTKGCDQKAAEWEERKKFRADEQLALADTIKMLTSDDALELFKKTIKGPAALLQLTASRKKQAIAKAKDIINHLRAKGTKHRPVLNFLALKLAGKKPDFSSVFKKIDEMIALMKQEQSDDDKKKGYCEKEFKSAATTAKDVNASIQELSANLEDTRIEMEKLDGEMAALQEGVKELDASIAEATENRQAEHAEVEELVAGNRAAVKLIGMAKDRLNHFYNPELAPDTATTTPDPYALSFVQISEHHQGPSEKIEVGTPPPTFEGDYKAQGEASTGILSMMDTLVKDLEKEVTVAETEEANAQTDYEETLAEAKQKRGADLKSVAGKARSKADFESEFLQYKEGKESKKQELLDNKKYVATLHGECDFLIENFDFRKQAREEETESMTKAKSVLAGADLDMIE